MTKVTWKKLLTASSLLFVASCNDVPKPDPKVIVFVVDATRGVFTRIDDDGKGVDKYINDLDMDGATVFPPGEFPQWYGRLVAKCEKWKDDVELISAKDALKYFNDNQDKALARASR